MSHRTEQANITKGLRRTHPENCAPTPIKRSSCCDLLLGLGLSLEAEPDGLLCPRPLLARDGELCPYVAWAEVLDEDGLFSTC
jgi:hypothetical protein